MAVEKEQFSLEEQQIREKLAAFKKLHIEPRQEWALSLRARFEQNMTREFSPSSSDLEVATFSGILHRIRVVLQYIERPAFVMPFLTVLVAGGAIAQTAQKSLPGDTFYSVRSAAEQIPLRLTSGEDRVFAQLELTQRRFVDLRKIAQEKRQKNIPSAISALEISIAAASKGLAKVAQNEPEKSLEVGMQIAQLQKNKKEIEQILGTKIGENQEGELQEITKKLVETELKDLQSRSLTDTQARLLIEAEDAYKNKDYQGAFEKVWLASNNEMQETPQEQGEASENIGNTDSMNSREEISGDQKEEIRPAN
ncbi:MAG: hypothetical protein A3E07_01855 [Candidatus Wildermuthbacteria bacterium RIFCSPHIGHO2_12_FULL_45_9]|uniref:DUF5667 domain-containing protein n=1 Tax=Candidatus Wildermuthbacteria bacterium RIFCSPHIGHO2_02_FULL_45_25 TaxID=1802450 RepID=A0A1G2R3Q7_9BACT|nr:MAG: hypothetical protein A3C04_01735 [Candidatus Wildermuthbacteria bacterium RIFCSPHIGHO2_02_FULL_45_25]OHA71844.1 MAG: hypothetical protein A3E07_01855 [Candidatus Wildermuthbacteria bacterium RIFCSPHIGHO2_12_FULL_45_9]